MLQAVAVGTFYVADDPDNPLNESLLKYRLECYLQMFRAEGEFAAEGFGAVEDVDRELLAKFKKMAAEVSAELLAFEKRKRDRLQAEKGEGETETSEAVTSEEKEELKAKRLELSQKIDAEEKKKI